MGASSCAIVGAFKRSHVITRDVLLLLVPCSVGIVKSSESNVINVPQIKKSCLVFRVSRSLGSKVARSFRFGVMGTCGGFVYIAIGVLNKRSFIALYVPFPHGHAYLIII